MNTQQNTPETLTNERNAIGRTLYQISREEGSIIHARTFAENEAARFLDQRDEAQENGDAEGSSRFQQLYSGRIREIAFLSSRLANLGAKKQGLHQRAEEIATELRTLG